MKQDISWVKLLAEGAALESEFGGLQIELANNHTQANAMQASARKLLHHTRNPTIEVSDAQIDYWLNDTTWTWC